MVLVFVVVKRDPEKSGNEVRRDKKISDDDIRFRGPTDGPSLIKQTTSHDVITTSMKARENNRSKK